MTKFRGFRAEGTSTAKCPRNSGKNCCLNAVENWHTKWEFVLCYGLCWAGPCQCIFWTVKSCPLGSEPPHTHIHGADVLAEKLLPSGFQPRPGHRCMMPRSPLARRHESVSDLDVFQSQKYAISHLNITLQGGCLGEGNGGHII